MTGNHIVWFIFNVVINYTISKYFFSQIGNRFDLFSRLLLKAMGLVAVAETPNNTSVQTIEIIGIQEILSKIQLNVSKK